jgi:hypothetical protein
MNPPEMNAQQDDDEFVIVDEGQQPRQDEEQVEQPDGQEQGIIPQQGPIVEVQEQIIPPHQEQLPPQGIPPPIIHPPDIPPIGYGQFVPPPPPPPGARVFSVYLYSQHTILDMNSDSGSKTFNKATRPLLDNKFDCKSDGIVEFLTALNVRAREYGWNDSVLSIPKVVTGMHINLLQGYGMIDLADIRAHVLTYRHHICRAAQDSVMLFHCLMNTLTTDIQTTVNSKADAFIQDREPAGAYLLKTIIAQSQLDTNATAMIIRKQLANLETLMTKVDSNIVKFNEEVEKLVHSLAARGQKSDDLLLFLFNG